MISKAGIFLQLKDIRQYDCFAGKGGIDLPWVQFLLIFLPSPLLINCLRPSCNLVLWKGGLKKNVVRGRSAVSILCSKMTFYSQPLQCFMSCDEQLTWALNNEMQTLGSLDDMLARKINFSSKSKYSSCKYSFKITLITQTFWSSSSEGKVSLKGSKAIYAEPRLWYTSMAVLLERTSRGEIHKTCRLVCHPG